MPPNVRTVAVTGAAGFIGRNLVVRLRETDLQVLPLTRETPPEDAARMVASADVVIHLASAVRPTDPVEFTRTAAYTSWVADMIAKGGRRPLVILSSSTSADGDTDYGRSKRAIEETLLNLSRNAQATVAICRLPNVFGKWARPNYNSGVATFCHNLARGLPIRVDDPAASLQLLYVDDLIDQWCALIAAAPAGSGFVDTGAIHHTTVGEVARLIQGFAADRSSGRIGAVGSGLGRALYATFVAALPAENFSYPLPTHTDARGSFIEMLKTPASGQFSYFTAHPGITRGGHYHHSKVEKFLIVHGEGLFRFRHIVSGDTHEIRASAERPVVVETVPGWTHDVTNVGADVMVSLIWANEVFDRERPDTVAMTL
jgi:UDP-2-acetamido-2,6-beta-L-arabino-hexul-4-ose reductase